MAQLPPKIPIMTPNWPAFPHQRMPPIAHPTNSWVDEFLDFSSTRRGSHRRSVSDSVTFLEPAPSNITAMLTQYGNNINNKNNNNDDDDDGNGFDRLDDEQLMSMFSDDMAVMVPPTLSNPSTPSDQNSNNDDKSNVHDQQRQHQNQYQHHVPKHEPGEVESSCMSDPQPPLPSTTSGDTFMDPKRVKRILANRQSAQRSRVRKLQYISELERSVTSLQSEVSALSPRVAFLDHQRLILNVDNSTLKQRIAALAQDKIFKDAHQEALKKEIERLTQVYHQQQEAHQPPNSDNIDSTDNDQLLK